MADTQSMPQPIVPSTGKKRKRLSADPNAHHSSKRASLEQNHDQINRTSQAFADDFAAQLQNATHGMTDSASSTAAVALSANQLSPDSHGLSFASNGTGPDQGQLPSSFDMSDPSTQPTQSSPYVLPPGYKPQDNGQQGSPGQDSTNGTPNKPVVGTDEWHKLRRDNHKEGSFSLFPITSHSNHIP